MSAESKNYGGLELNGFNLVTQNLAKLVNKTLKWDWGHGGTLGAA